MVERPFKLFETYCLPSVKNQSNQNFAWLVFFDIDTPKHYLNKINIIAENYDNFKPVFIDGFKELGNELQLQIELIQVNIDEFFIITRLDNDDIIHKNFIKTFKTYSFHNQKPLSI